MHKLVATAILALAAVPVFAQAVEAPAGPPAPGDKAAMEQEKDMGGMGHHAERTYTFTRIEADYARARGEDIANWDAEGWIGGDRHRFWWKSEGEVEDGRTQRAEAQALYSRNVWTFFDAQVGVRHDFAPAATTWAAVGAQGLMPYLLETELHAFVSTRGDVQLRAKQSFDLLMTNRLVVEPLAEVEFEFQDSARREVASGFSRVEAGVQTRYEIRRKFAPYVAAIYERRLGGTARLARERGEDAGGWRLGTGLRVWF